MRVASWRAMIWASDLWRWRSRCWIGSGTRPSLISASIRSASARIRLMWVSVREMFAQALLHRSWLGVRWA